MLETITSTVIQAVTAFALLVPVRFLAPEVLVGFGRKGLIPTGIHDVADFKRLFDEKITGVYIPIVFDALRELGSDHGERLTINDLC